MIDGLEDSEDRRAFEAAVIADYDARTAVEPELMLRLGSPLWRLRPPADLGGSRANRSHENETAVISALHDARFLPL